MSSQEEQKDLSPHDNPDAPGSPEMHKIRRRLSVAHGMKVHKTFLDGSAKSEVEHDEHKHHHHKASATKHAHHQSEVISSHSLSKVGFVPFNKRKVNQDRCFTKSKFGNDPGRGFYAVYDGHGEFGHDVSTFVSKHIPKMIHEELQRDDVDAEDLTPLFEKAFLQCSKALKLSSINCICSGCTATAVFLDGDVCYSLNVGDSRTVLGQMKKGNVIAVPLTTDQKPDSPGEKERITALGGRVHALKAYGQPVGPARVWLPEDDLPGLAMSRSFGDHIAESIGITALPVVRRRKISALDQFIILASDGVWEFISDQEAVEIVRREEDGDRACAALVAEATARWRREESVIDDITAVVVYLRGYKPMLP